MAIQFIGFIASIKATSKISHYFLYDDIIELCAKLNMSQLKQSIELKVFN